MSCFTSICFSSSSCNLSPLLQYCILQSLEFFSGQSAMILTREKNPDASVIAKADAVIAKNKLDK